MTFSDLISRQVEADRRRGFTLDADSEAERLTLVERDLVGLMGEVGEFANIVKKARLNSLHAKYGGQSLADVTAELRDELADAAIYLMRLSVMIAGDLEEDIVAKMRFNDERYAKLEQ
jgi:NTP pyrophosphatase (non-canonical NTP hydrolase)